MLHTFTCPHCGAPLRYDSTHAAAAIKCDYCEMSTPVPEAFRPTAKTTPGVTYGPAPEVMGQIQVLLQGNDKIEAINPRPRASAPVKSGGGCAALLPLLVIGAVIGGIVLSNTTGLAGLLNNPAFKAIGTSLPGLPKGIEKLQRVAEQVSGPFNGIYMREDALLLNFDDKAQPDILSQAFEGGGSSSEELIYIDTAGKTVRWRMPNNLQSKFTADARSVYLNNKTRLIAIDRSTGQTRWESTLSDEISGSCADCLQPVGKLLVALSNDDNWQAFDPDSGKRLWERPLSTVLPRFWAWGGKIVVMDRHEGAPRVPMQITVLDSAGLVLQQFDLLCKIPKTKASIGSEESANAGDAVHFDASAGMFYAWYGVFSSCVQKYDLTSTAS